MKYRHLVACLLLPMLIVSCDKVNKLIGKSDVVTVTDTDEISGKFFIMLGNINAQQLTEAPSEDQSKNIEYFMKGILDYKNGVKTYSEEDSVKIAAEYEKYMADKKLQELKTKYAPRYEKSKDWLNEKRKEDGIKETESGLLYKIIASGDTDAEKIKEDQEVLCNYTMKVFDVEEPIDNGERIKFAPNMLIPGVKEGMQLMVPGAHYTFYINPDLGYGWVPIGNIEPASALEFDVVIVDEHSDIEVE